MKADNYFRTKVMAPAFKWTRLSFEYLSRSTINTKNYG